MSRAVLIYRLGSLGDTVVALPCFNAIRDAHHAERKVLLTNRPVSSKAAPIESILGASTGFFDEIIAYPVGVRRLSAILEMLRSIRRLKVDTVVYMSAPRGSPAVLRDWCFFRLAGVRRVIGLPLGEGRSACIRLDDGTLEPEAERLARCLQAHYSIKLDQSAAWDLHLTASEVSAGIAITGQFSGAPFIAINTGGKAAEKDWGTENWSELLRRLARRVSGVGLLFVGAAEDSERAQALARLWPAPVVNSCGLLSPRESAAALRAGRMFIGHDSGPLHLAASAGLPCVGLFGSYNEPVRWHPYGTRHRIIHDMRGIEAISVDTVEAATLEVFERSESK